ncbi:MAG: hypothetical protein A4E73_03745 [Syntrophaceae bacterium PtaU1.Bin231]|nr:MAG: hypothetical protein A4E73_03745 [Syntrophaceae bacterium PtaU1.Bin231]
MNMVMKTFLRPILSDSEAQKRRPSPLKIEAMARIVPPAMASSLASVIVFFRTSCAMGESWERRPRPADTFRHSMAHSIHHWDVVLASAKV